MATKKQKAAAAASRAPANDKKGQRGIHPQGMRAIGPTSTHERSTTVAENMLRAVLLCDPGAEGACATEAQRYGLTAQRQGPGYVIVTSGRETIFRALYRLQTCLDVLLLISEGKDPAAAVAAADWQHPDLADILRKTTTFAVRSHTAPKAELVTGPHPTQALNEEVGKLLHDALGKKVDLDDPQLIIVPYATPGTLLLGVSLAGEMRKREYRVFTSRRSLRSTVAAAALVFAGYDGTQEILLPLEDDGTLTIEASLMAAGKSPFRYRQEFPLLRYWPEAKELLAEDESKTGSVQAVVQSVQHLKAVQQNAKIAGVKPEITKADIDWIDTRFGEHTFAIVAVLVPCSGKHRNTKATEKLADDLGYQARYVLKKGGTLCVIAQKPEQIAPLARHGFTERERHTVLMGEQPMTILILTAGTTTEAKKTGTGKAGTGKAGTGKTEAAKAA